ncbi:hypothetical protein BCR33DRAFT_847653 [Rhizoclosmatium globosum]|uniref:LSM2-LSM8 complex subunit LSM8 n=1 Tax=Rhizoclosmatium globosum TaxID=329046 RepID=A0A1Y2CPL0_9FUNG|nr:hypothetical protein BCR33DRAFT_847653 [Rhizoclosmatium globosum]|eukprot:ORY48960.1 hypothetical protein BCR33DRAFT_847653 [Rhizoclosmatium globosum]
MDELSWGKLAHYEIQCLMNLANRELKGFDQTCTLILKKAVERIIQKTDVTEDVPLGLYIIRGSDVAVVGELDAERDDEIDWEQVHAEPMRGMGAVE